MIVVHLPIGLLYFTNMLEYNIISRDFLAWLLIEQAVFDLRMYIICSLIIAITVDNAIQIAQ